MNYYDGDYEDGDWYNNKFSRGFGKITYDRGYYLGDLVNGKRCGNGIFYYNDGEYRDGDWDNNYFKQGTVKITYDNKDRYIRQYSDGQRNGKGTYYYKNGNYSDGGFVDGELEGYGEEKKMESYLEEILKKVKNMVNLRELVAAEVLTQRNMNMGKKSSNAFFFNKVKLLILLRFELLDLKNIF